MEGRLQLKLYCILRNPEIKKLGQMGAVGPSLFIHAVLSLSTKTLPVLPPRDIFTHCLFDCQSLISLFSSGEADTLKVSKMTRKLDS